MLSVVQLDDLKNSQDGLLSLLVPFGQVVLFQNSAFGQVVVNSYVALVRFASVIFASVRSVLLRVKSLKSASDKLQF